jgi:hypothetical protein
MKIKQKKEKQLNTKEKKCSGMFFIILKKLKQMNLKEKKMEMKKK